MATATKKAPKSDKTKSKTALILEYAKAHRSATAKEIAEKVGCSENLVHTVRHNRKKGKKKAKHSAQTIAASHEIAQPTPAEVCVTFVRAAGGFAEAKKLLLAAEFFVGQKIR